MLTEKWVSGKTTLYTATYDYNPDGQLLSATDNNSEYNYAYDKSTGLLTTLDNTGTPGGVPTVTFTYDMDPSGVPMRSSRSFARLSRTA